MGYCGMRIPGHTGTDFKHKKVFKGSKKLLNDQKTFVDVKIESREKHDFNLGISNFIKFSSVVFVIFLIGLFSIFLVRSVTVKIHKNRLSAEYLNSVEAQQNKEAADMLYHSAHLHYTAGNLDYAQDEIILALKLFPRNLLYIEQMRKVLVGQCEVNHKFCQEAKEYEDYLRRSKQ